MAVPAVVARNSAPQVVLNGYAAHSLIVLNGRAVRAGRSASAARLVLRPLVARRSAFSAVSGVFSWLGAGFRTYWLAVAVLLGEPIAHPFSRSGWASRGNTRAVFRHIFSHSLFFAFLAPFSPFSHFLIAFCILAWLFWPFFVCLARFWLMRICT